MSEPFIAETSGGLALNVSYPGPCCSVLGLWAQLSIFWVSRLNLSSLWILAVVSALQSPAGRDYWVHRGLRVTFLWHSGDAADPLEAIQTSINVLEQWLLFPLPPH
jgi:hypothetical protein